MDVSYISSIHAQPGVNERTIDYVVQADIDVKRLNSLNAEGASNPRNPENMNVQLTVDGVLSGPIQTLNLPEFLQQDISQNALLEFSDRPKIRIPTYFTFAGVDKSVLDEGSTVGVRFSFPGKPLISTIDQDINYRQDKQVFYTVRKPVVITASPIGIGESLVKITKTNKDKVDGVRIYRRQIEAQSPPDGTSAKQKFRLIFDIDFDNDAITDINKNLTLDFVDRAVDNTFGYVYRAIPYGFEGAPSLSFADFTTSPLVQGDVIMGEKTRVIPSINRSTNLIDDYFLNDANFLSPDSLVSPYFESVKVFCYNTERGIKIRCFNLGRSHDNTVSFSLVRRNVSLGEDKFVPVVTEPDSTNVIIRLGETQDANLSFDYLDSGCSDGHSYEYALRMINSYGHHAITKNVSQVERKDPKILGGQEISVIAEGGYSADEDAVLINTQIALPNNVFDYLQTITGVSRNNDVFLNDLIAGRENLNKIPYLIINRFDATSGKQRVFMQLGPDASKFSNLTDLPEIDTSPTANNNANPDIPAIEIQNPRFGRAILNNQFTVRFKDNTVVHGHRYFYQVRACVRDPFSVDANIRKTVTNQFGKFIVQPCKMRSPLFLKKGILPPTGQGENFILQEDLEEGRSRLLNRFTSKDEYELGEIAPRSLVPAGNSGMIEIPESFNSLQITDARKSRQDYASVSWVLSGDKKDLVDHFRVTCTDTYSDNNTTYVRNLLLHLIPNDFESAENPGDDQSFFVEDKLPRLQFGDESTFSQQAPGVSSIPDAILLQGDVDARIYGVKRVYSITAVNLDGTESSATRSRPIDIVVKSGDTPDFVGETVSEDVFSGISIEALNAGSVSVMNGIANQVNALASVADRIGADQLVNPTLASDGFSQNLNMSDSVAGRAFSNIGSGVSAAASTGNFSVAGSSRIGRL
tara:strand:+ start:2476 stop:5241 length:2766 start_codon:yes stop_codon:yes gene_type:complete